MKLQQKHWQYPYSKTAHIVDLQLASTFLSRPLTEKLLNMMDDHGIPAAGRSVKNVSE